MPKRITFIIVIIIFCAIAFSGYLHEQDIDDLAYVIALGFDVGEESNLKITFQVSIPSENGSNSDSGSSSSSSSEKGSSDTLTKSIECDSIYSGLTKINSIISKDLNLSHCKFIIFSEELATEGISEYISTLENNPELRSTCNIIISTCTAEEFLNGTNPVLENSTAKYYEIITTASKYTGYTANITLNDVYTGLSDTFGETCAILGTMVENNDSSSSSEGGSSEESSSEGTSDSDSEGSSSSSSQSEISLEGLAVFKGDKFVGELSVEETVSYLIITNNLKECTLSIPSPFSNDKMIDLHLTQHDNTKNQVSLSPFTPNITSEVFLEVTILSENSDFDYSSSDDINQLQDTISSYISDMITSYYEKTAKEYKSDISGLGKYAVYQFPTISDWNEFNWLDQYENSTFHVITNISINSSYFISS